MQRSALLLGIVLVVVGCRADPPPTPVQESSLRYVALGDSYTIGTSVAEDERWPNQLVRRLSGLELVGNLAVNGYTSRDVIEHELPALAAADPEFVTLLIGVNDVVQGVSDEQYAANVDAHPRRLCWACFRRNGCCAWPPRTTPSRPRARPSGTRRGSEAGSFA